MRTQRTFFRFYRKRTWPTIVRTKNIQYTWLNWNQQNGCNSGKTVVRSFPLVGGVWKKYQACASVALTEGGLLCIFFPKKVGTDSDWWCHRLVRDSFGTSFNSIVYLLLSWVFFHLFLVIQCIQCVWRKLMWGCISTLCITCRSTSHCAAQSSSIAKDNMSVEALWVILFLWISLFAHWSWY